jgi:hypothetical protein
MPSLKRLSTAGTKKSESARDAIRTISIARRIVRRTGNSVAKLVIPVLILIGSASAWCLTDNRPTPSDLYTCRYSNQVYDSDASLMKEKAPTHFRLMTSRYVEIVQAARGYNCSGTAAVAFNGHNYIQAGMSDDPGIAELIPTISSLTRMSLADSFDLTVFMVIFLGILVGYAGFWCLYPDRRMRWMGAAAFLCIGLAEARVADVYIFQISPLIAGIPWVLHFALGRKFLALNVSAALLALCCSWSSLVRIGTTQICMAFLIALFVGRYRVQKIFLPLLLVILACVPAMVFERNLIASRDILLAGAGETPTAVNNHPIWHAIYAGLGFIPNREVRGFSDTVAMEKVRSIDPTAPYTSARYEAILRHEVLGIAKHRPMLLIENLVVKGGIIIVAALILLFPARRGFFAERELLWLDAAFVLAIAMSAMNVVLVVPSPSYLLTFLCLTFLYSSVKLCRGRFLSMPKEMRVPQE